MSDTLAAPVGPSEFIKSRTRDDDDSSSSIVLFIRLYRVDDTDWISCTRCSSKEAVPEGQDPTSWASEHIRSCVEAAKAKITEAKTKASKKSSAEIIDVPPVVSGAVRNSGASPFMPRESFIAFMERYDLKDQKAEGTDDA